MQSHTDRLSNVLQSLWVLCGSVQFSKTLSIRVLAGCVAILTLSAAARADGASGGNLLRNPGFETPVTGVDWALDQTLYNKGLGGQSVYAVHSGHYSLRLVPNAQNASGLGNAQFGLGQSLNASLYLGQTLYFSGWMAAYGGATAVLRLVAVSTTGAVWYRELRQGGNSATPAFQQDVLDIPNDPTIAALSVTCQVNGTAGSAWFDDIVVSTTIPSDWSAETGAVDAGPDLTAAISVDAGNILRRIPSTLYGTNAEWVWNGNGLWNAGTGTLDPRLLQLTSDLGTTLLRFPGGFFSDFYHWADAVGPQDQRPPGRTLSPGQSSANSFGTDEVLQLAARTGGQVMITVNVLTGTPDEAAAWVQYVNNGSRRVEYWEIGNEPYVDLTQFDPAASSLTPDDYAQRVIAFAQAMKAVDPTIKVGAALDFNYGFTTYKAYPNWTDVVLQTAGKQIDFVAVHNGFAPVIGIDANWPARAVYTSMMAAPLEVSDTLTRLSAKIESILGKDSPVTIGISEWGPLFQDQLTSRFYDHVKTLGSSLYVASLLNVFVQSPRTELANAFKLVDNLAMGWIGVRDGAFTAKAPYYALELYTRHFGTQLLASETVSPGYENRSMGWVDSLMSVPYLDAAASTSDDGNAVYLAVVNRHFDRNVTAEISVGQFCWDGSDAEVWTLNGTAVDANTGTSIAGGQSAGLADQAQIDPGGRFNQGGPEEIWLAQSAYSNISTPTFFYTFPPHSVTSIKLMGAPQNCAPPPDGSGSGTPVGAR